jgi:predicted ribosome quality control (RQC) complex YloA/Tae2 family protein
MSLNGSEIDTILDELALTGNHVQKVIQTDFRNLYLQLFRPPRAWWLRICLENPSVRFHATNRPPRAKRSHQRFEDFLWSRVRGGRIVAAEHLFSDRIVRLEASRDGETTLIYLRLWGTRANVIVTDREGTILDAFFRKPTQGIETGGRFVPTPPENPPAPRAVRPHPDGQTLNEWVEEEYARLERERERERLVGTCRRALEKQRRRTASRLSEIEAGRAQGRAVDRYRHYGDLILANLYQISPGAAWVEVEDYLDNNRMVRLELDPAVSGQENATRYYDRARRSEESTAFLETSAAALQGRLDGLDRSLAALEELTVVELRALSADLAQQAKGVRGSAPLPGLEFESGGFRILVGRNARENDELLRRATRGNDWWLHTRDYPGGYVFVKAQSGKSVPLDVLLDAGNLALFFSKARSAGKADLYYTQVKYLRRAKDGPKGLVLPTQEKNLLVELDTDRLQRLGIGPSFE